MKGQCRALAMTVVAAFVSACLALPQEPTPIPTGARPTSIATEVPRVSPSATPAELTPLPATLTPTQEEAGSVQQASGCASVLCRLLRQLYDLGLLAQPQAIRLTQLSSQDRFYLAHYWDYVNSDELFLARGFQIRNGYDGQKEYVLLSTDGPGYIPRIWFTHRVHLWKVQEGDDLQSPLATEWGFFNEVGNIRFYFDGEPTPRIDMPVTEFFSGEAWPFLAPLVGHYGTANGGNVSYFPLPFARSIQVATTGLPRHFQIEVAQFGDAAVPVVSFSFELSMLERAELERAIQAWRARGSYPGALQGDLESLSQIVTVPAFSSVEIVIPGPATLLAVELRLEPGMDERMGLRIHWDGEPVPSVEGPLRALFGAAEEMHRYRALPVGIVDERGVNRFYNYFPMPFASQARMVMENGKGVPAPLEVRIVYRPDPGGAPPSRFHASFKTERLAARDDGAGNYILLERRGRGRWVGMVLTMYQVDRSRMQSGRDIWPFPILESDVNVWVDGRYALPGTGVEDDFNDGYVYVYTDVPGREWIFALSGNTWKDPFHWGEVVSQYRFYLADRVEFRSSIRVEVEHGVDGNNLSATYSSTAFWYQDE